MGSPTFEAINVWLLSLVLVSVKAAVLMSLVRFVWSDVCQHALDSMLHWVLGAAVKVCLANVQSWFWQREGLDFTGLLNLQRNNQSSSDAITTGASGDSSWAAHLSHESVLASPLFTGVLCMMFHAVAPKLARIFVR